MTGRARRRDGPPDGGNEWTLIVAVSVLALIATFAPLHLFSDDRLAMGRHDLWASYGPFTFFMDSAIHGGEVPLWNPLIFCGTPFAAALQPAVFYPPNLIRSLLHFDPTPIGANRSLWFMVMVTPNLAVLLQMKSL